MKANAKDGRTVRPQWNQEIKAEGVRGRLNIIDHHQRMLFVVFEREKEAREEMLDAAKKIYRSPRFPFSCSLCPSQVPRFLITNPITWWLLAINLFGRETDSFLPPPSTTNSSTLPPTRRSPNYNKDLH